jgi:hypothetical protein
MRDSFAAGERRLGCLGLACFFSAYRLIVIRCAGQGARKRIEHDFQEAHHGSDLAGGHAVDKFMRVLFLVAGTVCHEASLAKSAARRYTISSGARDEELLEAWNEFFGIGGR